MREQGRSIELSCSLNRRWVEVSAVAAGEQWADVEEGRHAGVGRGNTLGAAKIDESVIYVYMYAPHFPVMTVEMRPRSQKKYGSFRVETHGRIVAPSFPEKRWYRPLLASHWIQIQCRRRKKNA